MAKACVSPRPNALAMRQIAYFSTAAVPQTPDCVHAHPGHARGSTIAAIDHRPAGRRRQPLHAGDRGDRSPVDGSMPRSAATAPPCHHHPARPADHDRAFADWSMAYRREPALGQFDSFPQTLRYLDPASRRRRTAPANRAVRADLHRRAGDRDTRGTRSPSLRARPSGWRCRPPRWCRCRSRARSRSARHNAGRRPWARCRSSPRRRTAGFRPPRRSGCG